MAVLAAGQPSFAKSLLYEGPAQGTYNERLMINGYIAMNALRSQDTMVENTQSISWMHYDVWKANTSNITNCLKNLWTGQHIVNFAWVGNTLTIVCQRVPSRTGGGNWITNEANAFGHHCDQLVPPSFLLKDILVPCCPSFRLDLHMVPSISHLSVWFRSQLLTVLLTVPSHATNWAMYSPLHIYATSRLRWEGVCMA